MFIEKFTYFLVLFISSCWASFHSPSQPSLPKHQISICAIFKNEDRYLKEWIEYHRIIGIDHFYLYNNNSSDRSLEILLPYIKESIVTLISWPDALTTEEESQMWAFSTQIPAYENAIKFRSKNETEWLILMDIDEFLVPSHDLPLKDILRKYKNYPGILLQQDCFEASNISMKQNQLITEAEALIAPEKSPCMSVEKMLFKPQLCEYFTCSPYKYLFKNNEKVIKAKKNEIRINQYLHRFKNTIYFEKPKTELQIDPHLINENELKNLLEDGYMILDQEKEIYHYIPQLKKVVGVP